MTQWTFLGKHPVKLGSLGLVACFVLVGCGGGDSEPVASQPNEKSPKVTVAKIPAKKKDSGAQVAKKLVKTSAADETYKRLHQPISEAISFDPPVGDAQQPLNRTMTGKSIPEMYLKIIGNDGEGGIWDQIKFITDDGRRLKYQAILKTKLGNVTLDLDEEAAPNHVRNFIALASVGYYNGLQFERAVKAGDPNDSEKYFELIQAGCPKGTGEPGIGHMNYWLRWQDNDKTMEPGVLAAWHDETRESAACRFIIILNRAKTLDGQYTVFGRISSGMDVAQKILNQPKATDSDDVPENPVVIESVEIRKTESAS